MYQEAQQRRILHLVFDVLGRVKKTGKKTGKKNDR
jgi:hypothetical protein